MKLYMFVIIIILAALCLCDQNVLIKICTLQGHSLLFPFNLKMFLVNLGKKLSLQYQHHQLLLHVHISGIFKINQ